MSIGEEKESYICRKVGPALLIVDVLYIYMIPVNYTTARKLYMQEVCPCIDDPSIHIQMTLCCGKLGNRNISTFSNMNTVFLLMVFLYIYNRKAQSMMIFNDANSEGDYNGDDYNDGDYNDDANHQSQLVETGEADEPSGRVECVATSEH